MEIEKLLQKFYAGDSTPEDERLLMQYFLTAENMDQRWEEDRQLFLLLHNMQGQIPVDVFKRLEASIKQMTAVSEETSHETVIVEALFDNQIETSLQMAKPRRRTLFYWISSAAAIAILCISMLFVFREPKSPVMADTFSDPAEAALFAQQTLMLMSTHLNKGLNKVAAVEQEFERVDQILNKHLSK